MPNEPRWTQGDWHGDGLARIRSGTEVLFVTQSLAPAGERLEEERANTAVGAAAVQLYVELERARLDIRNLLTLFDRVPQPDDQKLFGLHDLAALVDIAGRYSQESKAMKKALGDL